MIHVSSSEAQRHIFTFHKIFSLAPFFIALFLEILSEAGDLPADKKVF
jgi:hypothetical protein